MKKKIIALLLVVATLMTLCVGCKNSKTEPQLSIDDVTANPSKYIEEGMKKSFAKSPFGDLVSLKDPEAVSVNVSMAPSHLDEYVKFDTTIALQELAVLVNLDYVVDGEELKGSFFIDDENIALKSDALSEIFDNTSVGVGLKDFIKNLKDSAWYKLMVIDSGLEEELKNDNGEDIDIQAIFDLYSAFMKDMKKIGEESIKYEVTESKMTYGETEVEGYQIVQIVSDDVDAKIKDRIKKFIDDLKVLLPSEAAEELEFEEEYMDEAIEGIKNTGKVTYFIAKKGGAVHKISYENKIVEEYHWYEETITSTTTVDIDVDFGAEPEKTFTPSFKMVSDTDGETVTVTGVSSIDTSAKAFKIDVDVKFTYPEDYEWTKEDDGKLTLTLDQDGNYKLVVEAGEGEDKFHEELAGKFKVDGTKVEFSVTIGEDTMTVEEGENTVDVVVVMDFNAKAPTAFEYDDLMKWDEEKVQDFIEKMDEMTQEPDDDWGDYEDDWEDDYDWDE